MSWQMWMIAASAVMLLVSALLALFRMVKGPTVVDRAIGNEVLVSTVVCVLGMYIASTRDDSTLGILISLALVGFVSSLAVARFVAGSDDAVVPGSLEPVVDGEDLAHGTRQARAGGSADPRAVGREMERGSQ